MHRHADFFHSESLHFTLKLCTLAEADNPVSEASEDVTRPTTTEVADEETTASNSCQCQCSATFGESEDEYDFLLAQELPPVTTTRDERTQATEGTHKS